ncbi:porin family protein [Flavobacterium sp.]|uniref:porin family protein n=1 Tax=Flavobacterium sp. TaxID=239 RepID=UPI002616D0FB|nr:porin family protein [Flavobacterium sp.]
MKTQITLSLLFIILIPQLATAQDSNVSFGIKAGADNFKHVKQKDKYGESYDFTTGFGFYVGGFVNTSISDNVKLQFEILYARHQRDEMVPNRILNRHNNPSPLYWTSDPANYQIREHIIQVPIIFQRSLTDKLYLELGPQFEFIVAKNYYILDSYNPRDIIHEKINYDAFDFGGSLGLGYNFNKHVGVTTRYFLGLIERDDQIKSSVFNLGLQYKI